MSDANSVMVPREPTEAMISAMHNAEAAPDGHSAVYGPIISCNAIYTAQYRAALAAAPASLGVEGEEVVAFWDGVKVTSDADARKAFKYVQTNFHSIPMVALRQRSPPTGLSAEEVEALERCGLPWNIDYSTDVPILCAALRRRTAQPDAPKPEVDPEDRYYLNDAIGYLNGLGTTPGLNLGAPLMRVQAALSPGKPEVDDAMVERACKADWGDIEWAEAGESKRFAERIIMRSVLQAALGSKE